MQPPWLIGHFENQVYRLLSDRENMFRGKMGFLNGVFRCDRSQPQEGAGEVHACGGLRNQNMELLDPGIISRSS